MHQESTRSTIKEVASVAGDSTQTVSRVINAKPDVFQETRRRVQEVIEKLRCQPSVLARSLSRRCSNTLGVVIFSLKYIGPARMLRNVTAAAEKAGYVLLLKEISHFDDSSIESIFRTLLSRREDGIIWAMPEIGGQGLDPVEPQFIILPPILVVRRSPLRVMEGGEAQGS